VRELHKLMRGPGVHAPDICTRLGSHLRAAWGITGDAPSTAIRGEVSRRLEALCRELPPDLSMSTLVAFGLYPLVQDRFLKDRIRWLTSHWDRDSRTVRRRIDTAVESLARDIAVVATVAVAASVPYELLGDLLFAAPPQLIENIRRALGQSTVERAYACATGEPRWANASSVVPGLLPPHGVADGRQSVGVDAASRQHLSDTRHDLARVIPIHRGEHHYDPCLHDHPVDRWGKRVPVDQLGVRDTPTQFVSDESYGRVAPENGPVPGYAVNSSMAAHLGEPAGTREFVVRSATLDGHRQDQLRIHRPAGTLRPGGLVEDAAAPDVVNRRCRCERMETEAEEAARGVRYLTVVYGQSERADRDLFHQFVSEVRRLGEDGQIIPRCGDGRWTLRIRPPAEDLLAKLEHLAHKFSGPASQPWQISRAGYRGGVTPQRFRRSGLT
jgi:hypothetical protein